MISCLIVWYIFVLKKGRKKIFVDYPLNVPLPILYTCKMQIHKVIIIMSISFCEIPRCEFWIVWKVELDYICCISIIEKKASTRNFCQIQVHDWFLFQTLKQINLASKFTFTPLFPAGLFSNLLVVQNIFQNRSYSSISNLQFHFLLKSILDQPFSLKFRKYVFEKTS